MADVEVTEALTAAARDDGPRVLSVLAAKFGDLDAAEEAVQDALISAWNTWPERGVPDNPGGWLMTAARRRLLDHVRSSTRERDRTQRTGAELLEQSETPDAGAGFLVDDAGTDLVPDERFRLLLMCCHPALNQGAQVALTLRLVGGLTTAEIGSALLTSESTVAQRISRAKQKIRTAGIPMSLPDDIDERLGAVLDVLYAVFNEGYLASGDSHPDLRLDLMVESLRLTRLLCGVAPESAEALGLLALELFTHARSSTRVDGAGELVLLEDQDRSRWDLALVDEANQVAAAFMAMRAPGPFQLQATIAGVHSNAPSADATDWTIIARLYGQLAQISPSPVVSLNHAVAVAMADGPRAGLVLLDAIEGLDDYHLLWATRAELHLRDGDVDSARAAFERALDIVSDGAERVHLERRLASVSGS